MKRIFLAFILFISIVSVVCCSQQSFSEIPLKAVCGSSASKSVTISADAEADAYVLTDGTYVSVTAKPYQGNYGVLKVTRDGSNWKVSYTAGLQAGKEAAITIYIGISSGAALSKQFGTIVANCEATAEPTEDQLNVTTSSETLVIGTPAADNPYQQAVFNRLEKKVSKYNAATTKAVVVFENAFGSLSDEQLTNIVVCMGKNGDVVFVCPDKQTFVTKLIPQLKEKAYEEEVLKYNTDEYSAEGVLTREKWNRYRGDKLCPIADSDLSLIEKNELLSIGLQIGNRYTYKAPGVVLKDLTDYEAGIMADGLAAWINETTAEESEAKTSELVDISKPYVQTNQYSATRKDTNRLVSSPYDKMFSGVIEEKISAYAMYAVGEDKDWYLVDQNIAFNNLAARSAPDVSDMYEWYYGNFSDGGFSADFIAPLDYWENKVSIISSTGGVEIIDRHPHTVNESYSSDGSTYTGTPSYISDGGSVGMSTGFCGIGFGSGFSTEYGSAVILTPTVYVDTGAQCDIPYLSVIYTAGTDQLSWVYQFQQPYVGVDANYKMFWLAPPLSFSKCNQQNSALFSVANCDEAVTLNTDINYRYHLTWYTGNGGGTGDEGGDPNLIQQSYTFPEPKRHTESWTISCLQHGDIEGNAEAIENFEKDLDADIFKGISRTDDIGGRDAEDLTDVNRLFDLFMDEFAALETTYAEKGYTGYFLFEIKSNDDPDKYLGKMYQIMKI